ncbi:glycosyl transferase family 1 protein [Zea mays]|uniref:Glycosyl transferase family 1 protein n=1 Tax=Zea mays TaxID=4577 RepID=A0A1D6NJ99_MAIZE|nr:glycosyl transferase family 1 protein [Zea mays]
MGSLENGAGAGAAAAAGSYKRGPGPALRAGGARKARARSRLARFLLLEKVDYLQWIAAAAAFFFVAIVFVAFLPGSGVIERPRLTLPSSRAGEGRVGGGVEDRSGLVRWEAGAAFEFEPARLREKWARERREEAKSLAELGTPVRRLGVRKPRLAMVFGDLYPSAMQLQMVSVASVLEAMGYEMKVFSLEDGPCGNIWGAIGVPVSILPEDANLPISVDWLDYDGILVNSIEARPVFSSLLHEPFKSIPIIWTVHEYSLAHRAKEYNVSGMIQLINAWKDVFSRTNVIVFPNYILPVMYAAFDSGNYFVIPGPPSEAFQVDSFIAKSYHEDVKISLGLNPKDFLIAIVGNSFSYGDNLMEEALVLQALSPLLQRYRSENSAQSELKVKIFTGNITEKHRMALESVALSVGFPRGAVEHVAAEDKDNLLGTADLVIYYSCLEEQLFPSVLVQAMSLEKLVIAPDLAIIRKHINDGVNGLLFPRKNIGMLAQVLLRAVSNSKVSLSGQKIASAGKAHAKNLMASETIEGYAMLLKNVVKLPTDALSPLTADEIPLALKQEWKWHLFDDVKHLHRVNTSLSGYKILQKLEQEWHSNQMENSSLSTKNINDAFSAIAWEEQRVNEVMDIKRKMEEDELKDRNDQPHGTWEEVYRNVKRVERLKNELHERDDKELERTGQPLCIYEPFFGEGTWPFLHQSSLYRGVGLANLSTNAESAILEAIQSQKHRDSFYFWVRMDQDPRNHANKDFWSFCDVINAGNCRLAVLEAFQRMYGVHLDRDLDTLLHMPNDGDTWSVMQSWVLPTRSFLEFVMFSSILDVNKDQHCYSRLLELIVNVWAFHSARRMVYVNPATGQMQEQHHLSGRRGQMSVQFFSYATLKSMDEELAEEFDLDHPDRRWLWPQTGEVFWQGLYERERSMRQHEKERRKQQSREKIQRIKSRARQKTLGKYIKPPPDDTVVSNDTTTVDL